MFVPVNIGHIDLTTLNPWLDILYIWNFSIILYGFPYFKWILQYSMFGSLLTIGAMLGAITSGRIADFMGRKGVCLIITTKKKKIRL